MITWSFHFILDRTGQYRVNQNMGTNGKELHSINQIEVNSKTFSSGTQKNGQKMTTSLHNTSSIEQITYSSAPHPMNSNRNHF
jgi:hypothetical protein